MANLDTNRAAFVQQEYRYVIRTNPTVKARNDSARTVEVVGNLDEATANALAGKYLAENVSPRVFDVIIQGVTFLDSFVGTVPTFILNAPRYQTDGRVYKVVGFTTDFEANTTTLQVRG